MPNRGNIKAVDSPWRLAERHARVVLDAIARDVRVALREAPGDVALLVTVGGAYASMLLGVPHRFGGRWALVPRAALVTASRQSAARVPLPVGELWCRVVAPEGQLELAWVPRRGSAR